MDVGVGLSTNQNSTTSVLKFGVCLRPTHSQTKKHFRPNLVKMDLFANRVGLKSEFGKT
jgi:ribosomal protein L28